MLGHSQNLGLIGSAVLTFIGYKRTNTQTDKQIKHLGKLYVLGHLRKLYICGTFG